MVTPDGMSQRQYLQKIVEIHDVPAQQTKFRQLPQHFTLQASIHPHFNAAAVMQQWNQQIYDTALQALIGTTRGTEFHLDLSHHGPHFLIAGTTGSGKSQLLRTLLLSLIYSYSPQRLAVIIIDFKGEAGLGPFSRSPHCKALISDLEESDFERTMLFLQADLTQRELMFKNLGISSYKDLVELRRRTQEPLEVPELLVVVDEFKMLIDKFPSAMAKLIKIATVGRSLGIHLILSTQRPQGTVSSDITSNIGTTICLRVASELESTILLGTTDAAKISPYHPGSGFIKSADAELFPFQALHIDKQREDERQASFTLTRLATGHRTTQHDVESPHAQEDEVLLSFISALPDITIPPEYHPVPPRPEIAQLPAKPHSLPLGILEVAQKGELQRLYVDSKTSPINVVATRSDCFALSQNLYLRGIESGFNVFVATGDFSSYRQIQQAPREGDPAPNALISPFDADFLIQVLQQINSNTENLLILDAIDLWLEENQKNFGAINQLTQFITQAESNNTLVIALSSQSLRGKFGQLFMSKVWSRSSFLQDPLLSASRNTLTPAHQKCYAEGEIVRKMFPAQEIHAGELTLVAHPGTLISEARVNPYFMEQVPLRVTYQEMSRFIATGKENTSLFGDFPRSRSVLLGLGARKEPQSMVLPPRSQTIILGARLSGKSQLFHTLQELNPTLKFHIIQGIKTPSGEEINRILTRIDDPTNTVVCIDDAHYLTYEAQKVVIQCAQQFQHVLCNSVATPKAFAMPLLSEHNGATRGIYLCPTTDRDAEFFTPGMIPLDFKTEGSVPAGRAIIVQNGECSTVQIATSDEA
ncbi:MAG: FtsK/SpoIIIE domain-containing protein [Rothia sp. (in: high G+C Gram-positive bacteria)]|nr:FtsK/SpoIIIE domain-containing protein [Rothia sp. (in: high G+C Gram-positive bacteria)]